MKNIYLLLSALICYASAFSQNIGIGLTNPTEKLDVSENIKAASGTGNAMIGRHPVYTSSNASFWKQGQDYCLTTDAGSSFLNAPLATGSLYFNTNNVNRMIISGEFGNVGIGKGAGTERLEVDGNIKASGGNVDAIIGQHPMYPAPYIAFWKAGHDFNLMGDDINTYINAPGATGKIFMRSNGVNKMIIDAATGKVCIGNSIPTTNLEIAKSGYLQLRINSTDAQGSALEFVNAGIARRSWRIRADEGLFYISQSSDVFNTPIHMIDIDPATFTFEPYNDNNINLGTSSFRWKSLYVVTGVVQTSDARLKKNIREINYGLETLMKLQPVSYEWKDGSNDGRTSLGFVAQDVVKLIPEAVYQDDSKNSTAKPDAKSNLNGAYGMNYSELIPVLVRSVQQQQSIIEDLRKEISDMKAKNSSK